MQLRALIAVGVAILTSLPLSAQPAPRRSPQATERCAAVGERHFATPSGGECKGFWNVYASIRQGDLWWFQNKDGADPKLSAIQDRIDRRAETVRKALNRCGITSYVSLSDWFDAFSGDLVVVHSNPYPGQAGAAAELARARVCGVTGFTKFSPYQISGRD
jgi:hypothetical protein